MKKGRRGGKDAGPAAKAEAKAEADPDAAQGAAAAEHLAVPAAQGAPEGAEAQAGGPAEQAAGGAEAGGPAETDQPLRSGMVAALLTKPIEGVQQVIEVLQARRGLAAGWALVLMMTVLSYLLDLGAGSLWNGDDALLALAMKALSQGKIGLVAAAGQVPPPTGMPLALWEMSSAVRLLGSDEVALRLLPALAALGTALCLLTIAIDVGVGRHAGGLGAVVLLALPMTYSLSHRALPDMLIAFAATGAVALLSHALHGHKFDRHILPHHRDEEAPEPLPLRRWPMVFAAAGVGAAGLVSPRAAITALGFAVFDVLLAHRQLLRKRRVWLALAGAVLLTVLGLRLRPGGLPLLSLASPVEPIDSFMALWHQGPTWYGRHVGPVVLVAAGVGLLFGAMRRASRPLLGWALVAVAMTWVGEHSPPPRGLGMVLPPLALCAAVGLETPVRWLGRLGMVVTGLALAGVVMVVWEREPVLHQDDTIRALARSQRHAPPDALLCTVGLQTAAPRFYTERAVEEFATVAEVAVRLSPGQPLSCIVPADQRAALERLLVPESARDDGSGARRKTRRAPQGGPAGSVLATVLDIEEPPPETYGPRVVLVTR